MNNDTICAIATPHGSGGVAIIRISGTDAVKIAGKVFIASNKRKKEDQKTFTVSYGVVFSGKSELDDVLVSLFKAPHSYTGEDVVEISCHGSVYIQQEILRLLVENGARLATPGEFTMRAFMNGKMDLSQAEAVADLISTTSKASHRMALNQMRGGFSKELEQLRQKLLHFVSMIELELDFGEEEVEFASRKDLILLVDEIHNKISALISSFNLGNAIKSGIPVAIAGETNVGKSTLLNAILNEDRAIVSDIPGTTRDTIEDVINMNGTGFRFIDTAGIRTTKDKIESMGIERTWSKVKQASIILYMTDARSDSDKIALELDEIKQKISEHQHLIVVINKTDLCEPIEIRKRLANYELIEISAKKKTNVDMLKKKILEKAALPEVTSESVIVSNARHLEALRQASTALERIKTDLSENISEELLTSDIREVMNHLGSITGQISNEEVLGNIFKNFCIGK